MKAQADDSGCHATNVVARIVVPPTAVVGKHMLMTVNNFVDWVAVLPMAAIGA